MKYGRTKVTSLSGETEVRFVAQPEGPDKPFPPFQLACSKRGIVISGNSGYIESPEDLRDLAKIVGEAWAEHEVLLKDAIKITDKMP